MAKWHDNSVVTIASNCETHIPLHIGKSSGQRRQQRGHTTTPYQLILQRNGWSGPHGQLAGNLSSRNSRKKWYWPLFINLLDVSAVEAWRIHCILEKANKLSRIPKIYCSLLAKSRSAKRKRLWKLCWLTCR